MLVTAIRWWLRSAQSLRGGRRVFRLARPWTRTAPRPRSWPPSRAGRWSWCPPAGSPTSKPHSTPW